MGERLRECVQGYVGACVDGPESAVAFWDRELGMALAESEAEVEQLRGLLEQRREMEQNWTNEIKALTVRVVAAERAAEAAVRAGGVRHR